LLAITWPTLIGVGLTYLRPHPLIATDYAVGALGILLGLFYFWVAYSVYHRRRYILNVAFACAGLGLLSFPAGTLFSILLLNNLMSNKHNFTK
jgi:exosortase/archaeosortase